MGNQIRDGKGGGYLAEVDSKNRLRIYAVVEDKATWINRVEEEMYSGIFESTGIQAATGGNWVVYLKNTSAKFLVIVKLKHRCTGASGSLSYWLSPTGTPGGSLTTLTPSNRNAGSNRSASVEMYQSTNITGLSGGRRVGSLFGNDGEEFEFAQPCSGYILPPDATLGIKADNNTSTHFGGMSLYFRD